MVPLKLGSSVVLSDLGRDEVQSGLRRPDWLLSGGRPTAQVIALARFRLHMSCKRKRRRSGLWVRRRSADLKMVETVGVEPTSESNRSSESTCVAGVLDWARGVHPQTTRALRRLLFRAFGICETGSPSPLNGVLSGPVGEIR